MFLSKLEIDLTSLESLIVYSKLLNSRAENFIWIYLIYPAALLLFFKHFTKVNYFLAI